MYNQYVLILNTKLLCWLACGADGGWRLAETLVKLSITFHIGLYQTQVKRDLSCQHQPQCYKSNHHIPSTPLSS